MKMDLAKLQTDVAAQTTVIQSIQTLLAGLSKEITDLKTTLGDPAVAQKAIDDLAAQVEANSAALTQAVTANTPDSQTSTV